MFIMMNSARLGVGMQGVGLTEIACQNSIRYARAFEPYRLTWAEDILQVGTLRAGSAPANWRACAR